MSARIRCLPCQYGDHAGHHEVVQAAPEGGVGGARCPCRGECDGTSVTLLGLDVAAAQARCDCDDWCGMPDCPKPARMTKRGAGHA